jgi:hypothetical protein
MDRQRGVRVDVGEVPLAKMRYAQPTGSHLSKP